jgi:hypothetical protein
MGDLKLITASILAILVAVSRLPNHGASRNASTICNRRNAPRRFDFHLRRGGIRAWGPSHYVAEIEA